jgi:hypothetical protein
MYCRYHCFYYSLSKSIEFVNFINCFRCLFINCCLFIGHIHFFMSPSLVFPLVAVGGCNGISDGPWFTLPFRRDMLRFPVI